MTKLLEEAIAELRELPAEEQDEAAEIMLSVAAKRGGPVPLDDETRAAVGRRPGATWRVRQRQGHGFKRHGV